MSSPKTSNVRLPPHKLLLLVLSPDQGSARATAREIASGLKNETSGAAAQDARLGSLGVNLAARLGLPGSELTVALELADQDDTLPYSQAAEALGLALANNSVVTLTPAEASAAVPFWSKVAAQVNAQAAAVLVIPPPPTDGGVTQLLAWLTQTLAAERDTRDVVRHIVGPDRLGSAVEWIAATWGLGFRTLVSDLGEGAGGKPKSTLASVPLGYNSWVRRCESAIAQLMQGVDTAAVRREFDHITANLMTASAMFAPLLNENWIEVGKLRAGQSRLRDQDEQREAQGRIAERDRHDMALEIETLKTRVAASEAELEAGKAESARSLHEVALHQERCNAEAAAALQARAVLLETRLTLGRTAIAGKAMEEALVRRAERQARLDARPLARWLGKRGWSSKAAGRLERHAAVIEAFLDEMPWPVVGVHPDGRRRRIVAYLVGATDTLADFPIVRNTEYGELHPDVAGSDMTPLVHFILHGQSEFRNPHPMFDTQYYLAQCPEASHLASSPVVHYLRWGSAKGFDPHPLFSTADYLRRCPDVAVSGRNPLLHWIEHFLITADVLFDPWFYLESYPDVAAAGRNPLTHYLGKGWHEGRNPNPWFDTQFYLASNPDCMRDGISPLVHYATKGWREQRLPAAIFDSPWYLANDPGLAGCDPLRHYIEFGRNEQRRTSPEKPAVDVATQPRSIPARRNARRQKASRRVALMIDAFYPRPDCDSGSLDHVNFARIFQRLGYEVHFLALLEFGGDHDDRSSHYRDALRGMGVHCVTHDQHAYATGYYFDESERIDVCFVSRAHFGGGQMETLRRLCPDAKIVFNTVDLHFVREEREGTLKKDPGLIRHALHTRELELDLAAEADATIVVSSSEKLLLDELCPQANTVVVPLIRTFEEPGDRAFAERQGLAFIGGYDHQPNRDAIEHFLKDVWPAVHRRRPDICLQVIGSKMPTDWVQRKIPGVRFTGFVEDMDAALADLRLTIAPLRYGAGAKGKLVSSLAAGVPAVVSPIAAEGMGLIDGQTILIADSAQAFADQIIRLHDDEKLWMQISQRGAAFIREHYSIDAGYRIVHEVLVELGLSPPATPN